MSKWSSPKQKLNLKRLLATWPSLKHRRLWYSHTIFTMLTLLNLHSIITTKQKRSLSKIKYLTFWWEWPRTTCHPILFRMWKQRKCSNWLIRWQTMTKTGSSKPIITSLTNEVCSACFRWWRKKRSSIRILSMRKRYKRVKTDCQACSKV